MTVAQSSKNYPNRKVLCIGDSHADTGYCDKPWPSHISGDVTVRSSPGNGTQIGVEKLTLELAQHRYDLVVFQTSHELRQTIGMNYTGKSDRSVAQGGYGSNLVDNVFLQGINANNNKDAMAKFHGKKNFNKQLYEGFDNFYLQYQADNDYEVYIRQLQHIYLVQQICKQYEVELVLFMWHPLPKRPSVLYDAWDRLIDWESIVTPSVLEWQTINKMKPRKVTVDGYHLNSVTSSKLVKELLNLS
jgi:hypothetical protein